MKRPTPSRPLAIAGAVAVLAAGAIAVPVLAQSGGSGGTTTSTATTPAAPQGLQPTTTGGGTVTPPRGGRGMDDQEYRDALAKELGISTDKLDAAMKAARETVFLSHLDEMVAAGRITKDEAQALRDAAKKGTLEQALKAQRLKDLREHLDQAVKDGRLTEAQADQIYKDAQSGTGGPGMFGDHHGRGHGGPRDMGPGGHWGP